MMIGAKKEGPRKCSLLTRPRYALEESKQFRHGYVNIAWLIVSHQVWDLLDSIHAIDLFIGFADVEAMLDRPDGRFQSGTETKN
jgi:hypothetical protein